MFFPVLNWKKTRTKDSSKLFLTSVGLWINANNFNLTGCAVKGVQEYIEVVKGLGSQTHVFCREFVGDEECIFVKSVQPIGGRLELFNVRSGDLLSVMDVEWNISCLPCPLATSPRLGLLAICSSKQFNFEIIKVKHPREETLNTETKM